MCESPDYLVALSTAAYKRFKDTVPDYGTIIYDPETVDEIDEDLPCTQKAFSARELALKNFDNALFANTLVLGFVARLLEVLDQDLLLESILEVIPKFHEQNRQAFQLGFDHSD
jgi:2-oxoglutarate ferredoxin oxidoreductase subunit gamma